MWKHIKRYLPVVIARMFMVDEMLIGAVAQWPKVRYIVDCF